MAIRRKRRAGAQVRDTRAILDIELQPNDDDLCRVCGYVSN